MANANNPFGLKPTLRNADGGEASIEVHTKDASYATALFLFDAVTRQATGYIDKAITPGTTLYLGVTMQPGAASKTTSHSIITSPSAVFEAQCSGAFTFADGDQNANLTLGAGVALTQQSGHQVNSATMAATATLDVKLRGLVPDIENEYGDYARVLLTFNKHLRATGTAGV